METLNNIAKHFKDLSNSGSLNSLVVINAGSLLTMTALIIIVVIAIRQRRYRNFSVLYAYILL